MGFSGRHRRARRWAGLHAGERFEDARFFEGARLNYAQNLLRKNDDTPALIFWGEDKIKRSMSWAELNAAVSQAQQAFAARGIGKGDRVAALIPNMPEAIIAMLAAASLGAIWTSASPDFGVQGVLDRFGQIEPKLFISLRRLLLCRQNDPHRRQGLRNHRRSCRASSTR